MEINYGMLQAIILVFILFNVFAGRKMGSEQLLFGVAGAFLSFLLSAMLFFTDIFVPSQVYFSWFGPYEINFLADKFSAGMVCLVTFLATMILTYAYAYMKGKEGVYRYSIFMQFFVFSMVGILVSGNVLQSFIFWEMMGLCSYVLIGFWFADINAAKAAKKAFMVTRLGDVLMLCGIMLLYRETGSFNYEAIFAEIAGIPADLMFFIGLLVFGGIVGKSAQFPLHVWLPEAMAGPTPTSALIHAATMVKAGLYLMIRLSPVFDCCRGYVLAVGVITVVFAGINAVFARELKEILAYSTISQLGYIVSALGAADNGAALAHIFNHASFKALLFLAAGIIIHHAGSNNLSDMKKNLKFFSPLSLAMLIAFLSMAGIPPLGGFWSKEAVMHSVLHVNAVAGYFLLFGSFLTALYAFRIYFTVVDFGSAEKWNDSGYEIIPILLLALPSIIFGFSPDGAVNISAYSLHLSTAGEAALPVLMGTAGIAAAYLIFFRDVKISCPGFLEKGFYLNEIYLFAINIFLTLLGRMALLIDAVCDAVVMSVGSLAGKISSVAVFVNESIIDGLVKAVEHLTAGCSRAVSHFNTGNVQDYMFATALGLGILLILIAGVGI